MILSESFKGMILSFLTTQQQVQTPKSLSELVINNEHKLVYFGLTLKMNSTVSRTLVLGLEVFFNQNEYISTPGAYCGIEYLL